MTRHVPFVLVVVLLAASMLAACGQTVAPSATPRTTQSAPATAAVAAAPSATPRTAQSAPAVATVPKAAAGNPVASIDDACSLLPKDDVSKILGQPVDEPTSKGLGAVCAYRSKSMSFDLTVTGTGGATYLDSVRAKLGSDALDLPGVGDQAVYNPFSYTLIMRKGKAAFLFFLSDSSGQMTEADRQAKEKALAVQLLGHLG